MIGDKVKKLREEKGINKAKLASDLNLEAKTITNLEGNKHEPSIKNVLAVAKYFNVSMDFLLDYNLDSSKEVPNIALSKEELKDLVDSLDYLSSKIKSLLDE
jgi:transcriptional regulator with XRE-family HTH domain